MKIQDRFALSEWRTLQFAPMWTFQLVAQMDGAISEEELMVLEAHLQRGQAIDDPLSREVFTSLFYDFQNLNRLYNEDARELGEGLKDTTRLLKEKAEPNQQMQFKKQLIMMAMDIGDTADETPTPNQSAFRLQGDADVVAKSYNIMKKQAISIVCEYLGISSEDRLVQEADAERKVLRMQITTQKMSRDREGSMESSTDNESNAGMKKCTKCGKQVHLLLYACPNCDNAEFEFTKPEDSEFAKKRQESASKHVDQGAKFYFKNRYEDALEEFKKALEINPMSATAYANLGVLCLKVEQPEVALKYFEKVGELAPHMEGLPQMIDRAKREINK